MVKDINQLKYTIQNGNRATYKDADALDNIIKYVNAEKERQLIRNAPFTKLAISILKQDIIKSGGNYKLAMRNLVTLCNIDLDDTLERFVLEVNTLHLEKEIEENGIDAFKDHPKWDKDLLKGKMIEVLSELLD